MNIYGKNGRIRGELIAGRLIGEGLLRFSGSDLTEKDGRNEIGSLSFGGNIFSDPEFSAVPEKAMEDFLFLFYYAEENPRLRLPLPSMTRTLRSYTDGHALSGMRLLRLFSDGSFTLSGRDGSIVLTVPQEFPSEDRDLQEILRELVRTIYRFSGDEGEIRTVRIEQRKEPADGTAVPVREDVRGTLITLHEMMDELDRNFEKTGQDGERFRILFRKGCEKNFGRYRVSVPDGFTIREQADGRDFVLYYPNPENPEEWEASAFVLMPEDFLPGEAVSEPLIEEHYEDSACWFGAAVPVSGGVMRFRIYAAAAGAANHEDAYRAAEALIGGIGAV